MWRTAGGYRLQPENPTYRPIDVAASAPELRVAGPVVGLLRLRFPLGRDRKEDKG